jgi:hypothetical protein
MGQDTLKVGIVGSRKYENRQKIKEFIFKLKNDKGTNTVIVSGGVHEELIVMLRNMLLN